MRILSKFLELMNIAHHIIVMSGGRLRDESPLPAFDEGRIRERDPGEAISK